MQLPPRVDPKQLQPCTNNRLIGTQSLNSCDVYFHRKRSRQRNQMEVINKRMKIESSDDNIYHDINVEAVTDSQYEELRKRESSTYDKLG